MRSGFLVLSKSRNYRHRRDWFAASPGPLNKPILVNTFEDFLNAFGGEDPVTIRSSSLFAWETQSEPVLSFVRIESKSNMLLVQEYLITHSLAQLKEEHGIKSSAKAGDGFFSLNYDQIESKPSPMVNQCRGLVLGVPLRLLTEGQVTGQEPLEATYVTARPFDRFFNLGDSHGASVDFQDPSTVFFEKLDGTLCILYYNLSIDSWEIATRAVPLADKPITGWEDMTFRKLFEKALHDTLLRANQIDINANQEVVFDTWVENLRIDTTYMFELTTPLNRIVVEYKDFGIHLLGMRDRITGQEQAVELMPHLFGVPVCPFHLLNNQEELLAFVGSKPPFEQEGIVVRDKNFNRVKVKSLAYMAYNRLRDSTANSPRAIMELILTEQLDDVLPVLETWLHGQAVQMQENTRKLYKHIDSLYPELVAEGNLDTANPRRGFAIAIQKRKAWMGPLMSRYLGKCKDITDHVSQHRSASTGGYADSFLDSMIEEANKLSQSS